MKSKKFNVLLVSGIASLGLASLPGGTIVSLAQSSSVKVSAPKANCRTTNLRASAPGVRVSAPNPSRLVPNVGKLLREGLGVPAPDAEAPDVGSPGVQIARTSVKCADASTPASGGSMQESGSTPASNTTVQGLW